MMDDTMEGGGVLFNFDKGNFTYRNINLENYCAVLETVRDYGVYENPGAPGCVAPINSEGFTFDTSQNDPIKSKYAFDWNEFKKQYPYASDSVRERFQRFDEESMHYFLRLLS